jgi:peptidoglycan L-alanyl-D-glutamate endopeptidase CwlK
MINSRDINDLHPKVQTLCKQFIEECNEAGITILITSTFRDIASQNRLFAQGRTLPGRIVTNARGGDSFHNYRVAFDFVPLVAGKAQWNDIPLFKRCGGIAKGVGLEWAGDWKRFKEYAHCQYTGSLTLSDFKQGKTL